MGADDRNLSPGPSSFLIPWNLVAVVIKIRNAPHRFGYLNACSPLASTVWGGCYGTIRRLSLAGGIVLLGTGFANFLTQLPRLFFMFVVEDVISELPVPAAQLAACCHPFPS